ncbi:hypothetical protein [Piscinibacter sp. XHJ-5]|uniref:hypothetical protein n=1 Tax=Piscinibacter sp. XHJ-5 TaxID=3037797 RepID=UPI002452C3E7|nr:hypothetical protein [Piscinibacter sp. XHJ-5]
MAALKLSVPTDGTLQVGEPIVPANRLPWMQSQALNAHSQAFLHPPKGPANLHVALREVAAALLKGSGQTDYLLANRKGLAGADGDRLHDDRGGLGLGCSASLSP